ncbi:hypothetical protein PsorP6_016972 [Peronosclerospora sorghi]|uniref:Uncharacterized protein n=1 Tax=Peronosclerospora sorghi TaxID=230839 RepID=A0ACC0WER3_9STRA|nr:hypothetical protein PsorP6_016972 [Peronosclerospora sorghi]
MAQQGAETSTGYKNPSLSRQVTGQKTTSIFTHNSQDVIATYLFLQFIDKIMHAAEHVLNFPDVSPHTFPRLL